MKEHIDEMTKVLVDYTKKNHIMASHAILEDYAEQLYEEGYRKQEWISVDERLPKPYMSVLVYMPSEAPHPTVSEGFLTKHGAWYAGGFDRLPDEVVMWKEMPEAPKMKGGAE